MRLKFKMPVLFRAAFKGTETLAVACLFLVALAGPASSQTPPPARAGLSESVAAVVNDEIISTFDLAQRMRLLIATSGIQPTQQNLPQFQREALSGLVDERLQLQELRRVEKQQKIDIVPSDQDVDEQLTEMARENNANLQQFKNSLAAQGIGIDTLREQVRAQSGWQRWVRGRYGSRLRIGEDQVKAELERVAAAASKPQYQIAEVFLDAARVGGMETAVNGAEQLVAQMQQGAPFPAVARQFSASPSAAAGGDVGWITAGEMPPEVDAALEQMRPGQLSRPIPVRDGVYIVYLRDRRAGASSVTVALKQAAIALPSGASEAEVNSARARLFELREKLSGCQSVEDAAARYPGVVAADLGEAELKDLSPAFRAAVEGLAPGQTSQPIRTTVGLHVLTVCGRGSGGGGAVTAQQVEGRLFGQQLSMIARRYMRDLRTAATIETR
ncbi:MAG: peptidylprolyl isomerase [Phenylobacterium sp.]